MKGHGPPARVEPAGVTVIVRRAPAPPRRAGMVDHLVNQWKVKSQ